MQPRELIFSVGCCVESGPRCCATPAVIADKWLLVPPDSVRRAAMGDGTDKVTGFFLKNAFPLLLGKERPSLEGLRRRAAEALMTVFTSGPAHNSAHSCQEGGRRSGFIGREPADDTAERDAHNLVSAGAAMWAGGH